MLGRNWELYAEFVGINCIGCFMYVQFGVWSSSKLDPKRGLGILDIVPITLQENFKDKFTFTVYICEENVAYINILIGMYSFTFSRCNNDLQIFYYLLRKAFLKVQYNSDY